jgi:hypothetical protein
MANNKEFNKIRDKLDGRHFYSKNFFDMYGNKINLGPTNVYIKTEVDYIFKELKDIYSELYDTIEKIKKQINDYEIDNYKLKKRLKKYENKKS